jgi:hypothetical protein
MGPNWQQQREQMRRQQEQMRRQQEQMRQQQEQMRKQQEQVRRQQQMAAWQQQQAAQARPVQKAEAARPRQEWAAHVSPRLAPRPAALPGTSPGAGLATVSLIAGILGLFLPLVSIIGLVLGYVARSRAHTGAQSATTRRLAMAGVVLGWIGIILTLVAICLIGGSWIWYGTPLPSP